MAFYSQRKHSKWYIKKATFFISKVNCFKLWKDVQSLNRSVKLFDRLMTDDWLIADESITDYRWLIWSHICYVKWRMSGSCKFGNFHRKKFNIIPNLIYQKIKIIWGRWNLLNEHPSPFMIFVSPVIINYQIGKMCHEIQLLLSLCILLLSWSEIWTEMSSFGKERWLVMVRNIFLSNCPVLITSFS